MTPRSFPLVPEDYSPDRRREEAMRSLTRSCISAAACIDHSRSPQEYARARWGSDEGRTVNYMLRAATSPATTTAAGWAAELSHVVVSFLSSLRPISAASDLLNRGLQLRFAGAGIISLPTITTQPAGFVGQTKAIPIVQFQTSAGVQLQAHKLALIAALTHEMISSSNAEQIVRQCLVESGALGLDNALFSANAATADAPAGLLAGVGALAASTASPATEAMISDLSTLAGAVARVAGSNLVFIAAPEQALGIRLRAPLLDLPVLASKALPAKTVIAVAADALVSGFETTPTIDASRDMEAVFDTAAGEVVSAGGVISSSVASVYQSDRVALRMTLKCAWGLRASNALAWVNATTW
jgi:hypothetical protein